MEDIKNQKIEDPNNQKMEDIIKEKEKLSIDLVKYIFSYLSEHIWQILCKTTNKKIPIKLIMAFGIEDYFENVLLSNRFKMPILLNKKIFKVYPT
jgi:hypothetical protein